MTVASSPPRPAALRSRPDLRGRSSLRERLDLPRRTAFAAAASMVAIVGVLLGFIAWQGSQLFLKDGIPLTQVFSTTWQPDATVGQTSFGLLPFVAGTACVTAVALLLAAPLSVGVALFLSEIAPGWARALVQPALEIFVGIPSVVWGWLGLTMLVPFLASTFHRDLVLSLPGAGEVLRMPGFLTGFSWLAGSIVLALMILPTITSVSFDAFRTVPSDLRTASLALGTTRWQTIRHILIPAARPGILTAIVLGMTRAAGEALAVQVVIGSTPVMPRALTQPLETLTAAITLDMGNTVFGEPWQDALWTMSLVLLALSIVAVGLVRLINRRAVPL